MGHSVGQIGRGVDKVVHSRPVSLTCPIDDLIVRLASGVSESRPICPTKSRRHAKPNEAFASCVSDWPHVGPTNILFVRLNACPSD